jgi:hypothetical protein
VLRTILRILFEACSAMEGKRSGPSRPLGGVQFFGLIQGHECPCSLRFALRTNLMIVRLGGPKESHISKSRCGAPGFVEYPMSNHLNDEDLSLCHPGMKLC